MQWSSGEVVRYVESPEYFDTAVIPCYRISLHDNVLSEQSANEEYMAHVLELESRLKGRIVLFPALVVYGTNDIHIKPMIESIVEALNTFKYIIFIPFDETLANQLKQALHNNNGKVLAINKNVNWFSEIVAIWNQK